MGEDVFCWCLQQVGSSLAFQSRKARGWKTQHTAAPIEIHIQLLGTSPCKMDQNGGVYWMFIQLWNSFQIGPSSQKKHLIKPTTQMVRWSLAPGCRGNQPMTSSFNWLGRVNPMYSWFDLRPETFSWMEFLCGILVWRKLPDQTTKKQTKTV